MNNILAAAAASAVVVLSTSAALACGQPTVAAMQAGAGAPKVLLAQTTQQGDPAAQPSRGRQSETTVGDKSAPPVSHDQATTSTNQPSVEQKEKVQKLGQELK
jgi:hypothetical protein